MVNFTTGESTSALAEAIAEAIADALPLDEVVKLLKQNHCLFEKLSKELGCKPEESKESDASKLECHHGPRGSLPADMTLYDLHEKICELRGPVTINGTKYCGFVHGDIVKILKSDYGIEISATTVSAICKAYGVHSRR